MYDPLRLRQFCASFDYRANLLPIPWDSLGEKREEKKKREKRRSLLRGGNLFSHKMYK